MTDEPKSRFDKFKEAARDLGVKIKRLVPSPAMTGIDPSAPLGADLSAPETGH